MNGSSRLERGGDVTRAALATSAALLASALLYCTMLLPGSIFNTLIEEDGWIETIGAIGLFVAAGFSLVGFARVRRRAGAALLQLSYLGLAIFFFASGGEEISWGQRILGFSTPEDINRVNQQGEFNVHNVSFLGKAPEIAFLLVWVTLAVVIPVAFLVASPSLRDRARRLVPIVPVTFAILFVGNFALAKIAAPAVDAWGHFRSVYPIVHSVTEIKEANFEILLGLAMVWAWLTERASPPSPAPSRQPAGEG